MPLKPTATTRRIAAMKPPAAVFSRHACELPPALATDRPRSVASNVVPTDERPSLLGTSFRRRDDSTFALRQAYWAASQPYVGSSSGRAPLAGLQHPLNGIVGSGPDPSDPPQTDRRSTPRDSIIALAFGDLP